MECEHTDFECNAMVNKLEDINRFHVDITIRCKICNTPFRFLGLPLGLDLNSATVSADGTEVGLAIAPKGETVPPIHGVEGYSIKKAE